MRPIGRKKEPFASQSAGESQIEFPTPLLFLFIPENRCHPWFFELAMPVRPELWIPAT
jgi:hypothetical protein